MPGTRAGRELRRCRASSTPGNPWELGLAEAQQVLIHNGLRGRVRLRTDGGLRTARDIVIAALLGADEFAFGTAVLVSLGCDMARQCHLNTCPDRNRDADVRICARSSAGSRSMSCASSTNSPSEVRQLLAKLGLPSLAAATGRTDLLEQVRWDAGLDLKPRACGHGGCCGDGRRDAMGREAQRPSRRRMRRSTMRGSSPRWPPTRPGCRICLETHVTNEDRTLGARLAGQIAQYRTDNPGVSGSNLTFNLKGVAGQSFGAFATRGNDAEARRSRE